MSSVTLELKTDLFNGDELPIRILDSKVTIGQTGPTGMGFSSFRPTGKRASAKYSGAAYALDKMIVDKCVNTLDNPNAVDMSEATAYTEWDEVNADGSKTRHKGLFQSDSKTGGIQRVSIQQSLPGSTYEMLVPVVAFALSDSVGIEEEKKVHEELKRLFSKIYNDYTANGQAEADDVLRFCDTFFYGFVKLHEKIVIASDDLAKDFIVAGYDMKLLELSPYLDVLGENRPEIELLKGVKLRTRVKGKKSTGKSPLDDMKEGSHAIDFQWNEEQQLKIPNVNFLDEFVPTEQFYSILKKIDVRAGRVLDRMANGCEGLEALGKDYVNVLMAGKPGTGKTTLGYALGAALRMPVYTITNSKHTEEDNFQGMQKVIDGGLKFVPTDFLYAYKNGGIVILEEINLADPAVVMGALGQAIEAPFILMEDGYKPVRRHPLCIIIGTMNIGTYGAKGVSQAFSSRFKQTYVLDDPKKEDFISILEKAGHSNRKCKWVYEAYTKINEHLCDPKVSREDVCLNVTLRGCLGALECMEEGDGPQQAIYNSLIGKIAEIDLELAQEVNQVVIGSLPNLVE